MLNRIFDKIRGLCGLGQIITESSPFEFVYMLLQTPNTTYPSLQAHYFTIHPF